MSAIEKGEVAQIDPRAAREAEMKANKAAMLKGEKRGVFSGLTNRLLGKGKDKRTAPPSPEAGGPPVVQQL